MTVSSRNSFRDTLDSGAINQEIHRVLASLAGATLCKIIAVHGGGVAPVGTVDVTIILHQQTGDGSAVPHGTIYGIPYIRIQGGSSAVICDPKVDDLGFLIPCCRDISLAKKIKNFCLPASFRKFDYADSVYIGGLLNAAPTEYVSFTGNGVVVNTPGVFEVKASSMEIGCSVSVSGSVSASGDVKAGSISLEGHVHTGVKSGSDSTGGPK